MHVVKPLKSHVYPTYQLYAQVANSKALRRLAVPGQVIETDIAFHIHGVDLECRFQAAISDLSSY